MPAKTRATMTDEERDARREEKRQHAERQLDELLSQDGWSRWLNMRRNLHHYSWTNQVLIAQQAHEQAAAADAGYFARDGWANGAPDTPCAAAPTLVKSASRWKRDGYHPAKGTRALYIWTFRSRRRQDGSFRCCGELVKGRQCEQCGKPDHYFMLGPTFDASQVRAFETGEPPELRVPAGEPIAGEHPGALVLEDLAAWAIGEDLAASIDLDAVSDHGEGGSWNTRTRELRVCGIDAAGERVPANRRLRTLIHELAHALGVNARDNAELTYADAEVAVECVSYVVASTAGLDTSGEAIPYMAGWGGEEARGKVRALAALIDATAKRLEAPLMVALEAIDEAGELVELAAAA